MVNTFTQKQCIKALKKIGFTDASKRRSKHLKFKPPENSIIGRPPAVRPFITVPKHKFYCQNAIVAEIEKLCGTEMKESFLKNV